VPIYEYQCRKCRKGFEYLQRMSDPPKRKCESCGGQLERQISQTSFQLKGGGWYKDLYSSPKPASGKSDGASSDSGSGSGSSSDGSTGSDSASGPAAAKDAGSASGSGGDASPTPPKTKSTDKPSKKTTKGTR
jgi:putative FmdB family regulatory protein